MEYQTLSPNIGVQNVDETVRFYAETLGFNLIMSVPSPKGGLQWAMVTNGSATLMFQEMGNLIEEYPQLADRPVLGAMTFYLKMKGMQALYDKLQGTEFIAKERHKTFYGADEFAIFDNNGHILTITEDAEQICQSCGMNMKSAQDFGTNTDGTTNQEYCNYCYQNGAFTRDVTMEEMMETNLKYLDHWNTETGNNFTVDEARLILREFLSTLKRWKKD